MEPLTVCLHYLAVFAAVALLVAELCLCNEHVQPGHVRLLARIDLIFLAAMGTALVSGLLRVFAATRGAWYFLANPVFWLKVAAFVLATLLAAYPTWKFAKWNRAVAEGRERILHGRELLGVRRMLAAEVVLLALLPPLSVWMARNGVAAH